MLNSLQSQRFVCRSLPPALAVILGIVLNSSGAFAQQPASRQPIERFVPADAFLVLATDDAEATSQHFQQTPWGGNLQSAWWKNYFAAMEESDTASALHLRPWFGIDWPDLAEFTLPVCLSSFIDSNQKPATALIIDVRDHPEAADTLRKRVAAYFGTRQARILEDQGAGGKRIVYQVAATRGGDPREIVAVAREGYLALVTSRGGADVLQAMLAGKGATLANASEFQQVQKQASGMLEKPGELRFWLKPFDMVRSFPAPQADGKRGRRDWRKSAERLGIAGLHAVGGSIHLSKSDAVSMEIGLGVLIPRPLEGALQMAALTAGKWRDPPAWADSNVASWTFHYREVEPWFEGFGGAFDEAAKEPGGFRDFLDGLKTLGDGPRIDVRREIVPRLEPPLTVLTDFGGAKPDWNASGRRDLVILEVKESDELEKVFRRWFAVDVEDKRVRLESMEVHSLWTAEPGRALFIDSSEDHERHFTSLALTKDALLLSTDEDFLRGALHAQATAMPLANDPLFLAARKYLLVHEAETTALRAFARGGAMWQVPYTSLAAGKSDESDAARALLQVVFFGKAGVPPKALAQSLPQWRDVAPAMGVSAVSVRSLPKGFTGVVGILRVSPPEGDADRR